MVERIFQWMDALDEIALRKRMLTLTYHFPVCPVCHREQEQHDRAFIRIVGMCPDCEERRNAS